MAAINLYDTLAVEDDPTGQISLECRWARSSPKEHNARRDSGSQLPPAAGNLAFRALDLLRKRHAASRGARLKLIKRIPAAAGLGGASSDAAAALVAANRLWNVGLSVTQLAALAAELGSDVPFFLEPGAAICRGRGERIQRTGPLAPLDAVVVRPPVGLATAEVYCRCKPGAPPRSSQPLVDLLRAAAVQQQAVQQHAERAVLSELMFNRLEVAAAELTPWVKRLQKLFENTGCLAWQLTGSGSCYFGVCRSAVFARRLAARLCDRGLTAFAVRTLTNE
jgi:4-diphosphocytidyl-2-C-methyl-D-erythritol kinase